MSKYEDADLILKLYDLRREATMREARNWLFTFNPTSVQDVIEVLLGEHSGHYRMVISYWDMAAAMVNNGAIDEWREHDLAAKAENRRRAAHQAKLTRSLKKAKSARPPERSSAELSGWEEFDRDGLLR